MKNKKLIFMVIVAVLSVSAIILSGSDIFKKIEKDEGQDKKEEFSYTPVLYKLCDDDSCIHLLGSIHVGDDRVTKFSDVILGAYNQSEYLAVEIDTTDIVLDQTLFMLDAGDTLDNYVDEELNKKLKDFSTEHVFFPYEQLKGFTLGYIYDYISLLPWVEYGYLSDGVDAYFLKLAHKENKNIISLETYESQLAFFTDYSDEFYMDQIEYMLDNYDDQKELSMNLYEAYLSGNKDNIEKILSSEEDTEMTEEEEKYNQAMIYDRNVNMASDVEKFLEENKNVFMVVGAAHVLGDGGIIDLLQDKNYKINIVK